MGTGIFVCYKHYAITRNISWRPTANADLYHPPAQSTCPSIRGSTNTAKEQEEESERQLVLEFLNILNILLDGEELVERYLLRLLFLVVFSLMVIHAGPPLKSDGRVIGIVSARCTEKEIEFISSFFSGFFLPFPLTRNLFPHLLYHERLVPTACISGLHIEASMWWRAL